MSTRFLRQRSQATFTYSSAADAVAPNEFSRDAPSCAPRPFHRRGAESLAMLSIAANYVVDALLHLVKPTYVGRADRVEPSFPLNIRHLRNTETPRYLCIS